MTALWGDGNPHRRRGTGKVLEDEQKQNPRAPGCQGAPSKRSGLGSEPALAHRSHAGISQTGLTLRTGATDQSPSVQAA